MEQAIDTGDGAPSKAPVPPLTKVEAPPRKDTTESLIDSAMDFLSEEGKAPKERREDSVPKRQRKEEPDFEDGFEDEEGPGDEDEEDAPPEGPETDEGEDEDEGEPDTGRGSEDDPFTVQDLPADKFIELKIDGVKTKVSLAELGAGYIREQTFHSRINQTQRLAQEATQLAQQAKTVRERTREEFREFISDPDQIYSFFMATEDREKVFEAAAHKYAALLRKWAQSPNERVAWERQRNKQRLDMEREAWEAQKQAEVDAKRRAEADQQARAIFEPGWQTGLRKAGFPQPTKELFEEVMIRVNQKAKTGQMLTSDDIAEYTYRACKLLELQPASAKAKPKAPQRTSRPAKRSTSARGNPWADMEPHQKKKDPDFWLRGLKERDFR